MKPAIAFTFVILVAFGACAQEEAIVPVKVTESIYMLEGRGGNVGVLAGEDGLLMVDDKFAEDEATIRTLLKDISLGPLKFVLNTHYHRDHTGGNEAFGKEAVIIAHENVRSRLSTEGKPATALPVITYEDGVTVHFDGQTVDLVHVPAGHTDTDTVVFFKEANVVHMGDQMFAGRFPYIDLDGGGTVQGYLANQEKILALMPDDAKVIPGHGPLSTKADLQACHDMIASCWTLVQDQVKAGKSAEEVVKGGVPAAYKSWSWRFISEERWLKTLYDAASK